MPKSRRGGSRLADRGRGLARAAPLLLCGLLGCSYFTEFVVTNHTDQPISITYSFAAPRDSSVRATCPLAEPGNEVRVGRIRRSLLWSLYFEGQEPATGLSADPQACRASFTLAPGASASVLQEVNYFPDNPLDRQRVDRLALTVSGRSGEVRVEAGQAHPRLARRSDQLYELAYR